MVKNKMASAKKPAISKKSSTSRRSQAAAQRKSWDDSSRLALLLEIANLREIKLSEEEWRSMADILGGTWNANRLQYGTLMANRFPNWKRGAKATKKDLPSNSGEFGAVAGNVDPNAASAAAIADLDTSMQDEWEDCLSDGGDIEHEHSEEAGRDDSAEA